MADLDESRFGKRDAFGAYQPKDPITYAPITEWPPNRFLKSSAANRPLRCMVLLAAIIGLQCARPFHEFRKCTGDRRKAFRLGIIFDYWWIRKFWIHGV